mgnify:CR=1 FL=1
MKAKAALSFDEVAAAIPEATAVLLERVVSKAVASDLEVHLVGGPVRDLLLGRPLDDVDLRVGSNARALADADRALLDMHQRYLQSWQEVVLVTKSDAQGAQGVVLNRPAATEGAPQLSAALAKALEAGRGGGRRGNPGLFWFPFSAVER